MKVNVTQEWDPSLASSWKNSATSASAQTKAEPGSASFGETLQSLQTQSSQVAHISQNHQQSLSARRSDRPSRNEARDASSGSSSKNEGPNSTSSQGAKAVDPKGTTQKPSSTTATGDDETKTDDQAQQPAAATDQGNLVLLTLVPQNLTAAGSAEQAKATAWATSPTPVAPSGAVTLPSNPVTLTTHVTTAPAEGLQPAVAFAPAAPEIAGVAVPITSASADANASQPAAMIASPLPAGDQADLANSASSSSSAAFTYSSASQPSGLTSPTATTTVASPAVSVHAAAQTIAVEAARVAPGGKSEIVLRLDPPDLGSIKVQIQHDPNGMRIDVIPQKVHAADLLQSQVDSLKSRLENAGLGHVHVQIRQDQSTQQQQQNQRQEAWEDVSLDSISAGLKKVGSPWKATALPGQAAMALSPSVDFMA